MKLVLFTDSRLKAQPALNALRAELAACPDTEVVGNDLRIDVDSECYRAIRARIAPTPRPPGKTIIEQIGPRLWKELHSWALTVDVGLTSSVVGFLVGFSGKLPCGECRKHWDELVSKNPIRGIDTNEQLFGWTVYMHNQVNRMLGKPDMELDEAVRRSRGE